jgi:hypothetical protein
VEDYFTTFKGPLKGLSGIKGMVHFKMKLLSFTHPKVVTNLYEFLSSVEHKGRYFEECQ